MQLCNKTHHPNSIANAPRSFTNDRYKNHLTIRHKLTSLYRVLNTSSTPSVCALPTQKEHNRRGCHRPGINAATSYKRTYLHIC